MQPAAEVTECQHVDIEQPVQQSANDAAKYAAEAVQTAHAGQASTPAQDTVPRSGKDTSIPQATSTQSNTNPNELAENVALDDGGDCAGSSEKVKAPARMEVLGKKENEEREGNDNNEDEIQVIKAKHDCEKQDCDDQVESEQKKEQKRSNERKDDASRKGEEKEEESTRHGRSACRDNASTSVHVEEAIRVEWRRRMRKSDVKVKWKQV